MKVTDKKPLVAVVFGFLWGVGTTPAQAIPTFTWHPDVKQALDRANAASITKTFGLQLNLMPKGAATTLSRETASEDYIGGGGTRLVKSGSSMRAGTALVVENGTAIIAHDLKGDGGDLGAINVLGKDALLLIDGEADVQVDSIEVGTGAVMVIRDANNLVFNNLVNNGTIIFDGNQKVPSRGVLTNNGTIYLANPTVPGAEINGTLPALNIVNNGLISTAATMVSGAEEGDIQVGVLDANLECTPGSRLEILEVKKAETTQSANYNNPLGTGTEARDVEIASTPSSGSTYLTVTGPLSSSSTTMTVTITPTYYGQFNYGGVVGLSGAELIVKTPNGYNPPNTEVFNIIKAVNIGGAGFGMKTYIPSTTTYRHLPWPTLCQTTPTTRYCYPIQNDDPDP